MTPYLYAHENPNSRIRENGKRFWGYPSRKDGGLNRIKFIGIHTAETTPSRGSAENIARYFTHSDRPASYHHVVDSSNSIILLPDMAVAFGIVGFNTPTLQLSFATYASWWGRYLAWDKAAIELAARKAAEWVRLYDIPIRWQSRDDALQGQPGFVRHSTMDPNRRSDPGDRFPQKMFFDRIRANLEEDEPMLTDEEHDAVMKIPKLVDDLKVVKKVLGSREGGAALDDLGRVRRDLRQHFKLFWPENKYEDIEV